MGRGPTVAGQKEASSKAKAKVYSMHSKLIALASEKGADPSINRELADTITDAKRAGVTADVIERAVRRGAGLDKENAKVEEIFYEGYAPGGVALIVRTLTDNRNRTAPSMRHIFSAFGGNLGETGSVSGFLYEYVGKIVIEKSANWEEQELAIMETDALDYRIEGTDIVITTDKTTFLSVKNQLLGQNMIIQSASLEYAPKSFIEITDHDTALKIYKMLEEFENDEDVENVWNNADISDTLWKEVADFAESKRFRT